MTDLGPYLKYTQETLEDANKKSGFSAKSREIHKERCDADLMYAILEDPQRVLTLANGTRITLEDHLLGAFVAMVTKKNAPVYSKSSRIATANAFLTTSGADSFVKQFNILFLVAREPLLQETVRNGLIEEHPGNLWGTHCHAHFDEFLAHLKVMSEQLLNWNYNECHIVENVRQFVHQARKIYITT